MIRTLLDVLFGCRHKHVTRPITPIQKRGVSGAAYVACLDCGKQFAYDTDKMRIGRPVRVNVVGQASAFEGL